ncbi:hypothetical protein [Alkalihalobacillus sp. BA299]|uniref:hypothetical protein n=1 Tax=Alkalihalobacillus sp. BA299 TaxID=2815938 RepID=UPI001ADC1504|nr:hypothetical protein [Alkalihalobacillus sp. BA299]
MEEKKQEQTIEKGVFRTNLLLPWLTTDLEVTTKRFIGYNRNTLLGLIPFGKNEVTFPLKNIASVSTSTKFHGKRFAFGLFFVLASLAGLSDNFASSVIFFLIGILPLLNSYTSTFKITNNAGESPTIEISILEKGNVQSFANKVNDAIVYETA